jgi:hypothetical protein
MNHTFNFTLVSTNRAILPSQSINTVCVFPPRTPLMEEGSVSVPLTEPFLWIGTVVYLSYAETTVPLINEKINNLIVGKFSIPMLLLHLSFEPKRP